MKKTFLLLGVFYVLNILQISLFPSLSLFGARPDLCLLLLVPLALRNELKEGVRGGLIAGTLQDLSFAAFFGFNIVIKFLIGYLVGSIQKRYLNKTFGFTLVIVLVASVSNDLLSYLLVGLFEKFASFDLILVYTLLPSLLVNLLFAPFGYYIATKMDKYMVEKKWDL